MNDEDMAFLVRALELALQAFTDRASEHARAQVIVIRNLFECRPSLAKEDCTRLFWKVLANPPGAVPLVLRNEAAQQVYEIYNTYLKEQERKNQK